MDLLYIALASITFLSYKEKLLLKKNLDSIKSLALLSIDDIQLLIKRVLKSVKWNPLKCIKEAEISSKLFDAFDIKGVTCTDCEFPAMLMDIPDPPYAFFYRGNLEVLNKNTVSVVGTRNCTSESSRAAFDFSKAACDDNMAVVSGLAYGIDSFAHKGALSSEKDCCTAAIIPSGIDTIVPYGHKKLAQKILERNGLIASEYVPGTPAMAFRFVERNRIIAALSASTVVIHAPGGSGSLITADFALDYNRELYFHSVGFSQMSEKVSQSVEKQKALKGKQYIKSARSYVEDGAAVISDYADFIKARLSPPGYKSCELLV